MSSTHSQQPLFVIYDRQYGTYIRLYDYLPARFDSRDRYTLFDLQQQESYSGDWMQPARVQPVRVQPARVQPVRVQPARVQQRPQQREPPKFVTDLILRDAAAEGKLCPITMDPIEATEEFQVTPCYHAFNKEALGRWLREHSTCPECNQRVY